MLTDLARKTPLFSDDTPVSSIEAAFLGDDSLLTVLVGDAAEPDRIRLVERSRLLTFLCGRLGYGRAIHSRETVAGFDAPAALILDSATSVADAAALAIARGEDGWMDAIAVCCEGSYAVVAAATLFKHVTDELAEQVERDHLTGLYNRRGFLQRLESAIRGRDACAGRVLLLIDLDGFKLVNDALGHQVGDDLLRSTARRIERAMPGAAVGRMGGDEFAVLATRDAGTTLDEVGWSLVQRLGLATQLAGTELTVPASVGVTAVTQGLTVTELMHRADVALYRAKGAGRNCYCVFDSVIDRDVQRQLSLSQELRDAIERDDLRLHYQPVVDLDTCEIVAFEALARWNSPTSGPVSPVEFIGLAERTGLIVPLGRRLLDKALRSASAPGRPCATNIHVNMSRRELHQPDLVRVVKELVGQAAIDPRRVVIEVTETSVAVDQTRMIATLCELSEFGVRIALDDFGEGATALSNLWQFPLDIVKLDQSLIAPLGAPGRKGQQGENRVGAIVDLCHAHDLVVTAEGVEHPEQARVLRELDCDYAQGWYFGRPGPTMASAARVLPDRRCLDLFGGLTDGVGGIRTALAEGL